MNHTQQDAKVKGSGALSSGLGAFILAAALALLLLDPGMASAAFTRPFLRQITGTPAGSFEQPGGVALDGGGNLWVSDGFSESTRRLDEFESASAGNGLVKTVALEASARPEGGVHPESLADDYAGGHFYITGSVTTLTDPPLVEVFDTAGGRVASKAWEDRLFGRPAHVAVDNSTDPLDPSRCVLSVCTVYVAQGEASGGDGSPGGIRKFNSEGAPESFTGCAECSSYISGNEITGVPGESFSSQELGATVQAVAVGPEGNIYAVDRGYNAKRVGPVRKGAVVEYNPQGVFVRAFTGEETPGLGTNHEGFGAQLEGVAVDPVSGDVLVSLQSESVGAAAVDEFDASGHFLHQITQAANGSLLRDPVELAVDSQGDLYVADRGDHVVDVYGPGRALPSVTLAEASGRKRTEAVVSGSVNPEGQKLSACEFQYVTEQAFEHSVETHGGDEGEGFSDLSSGGSAPCQPEAKSFPEDSRDHPVQAELTGLTSGTTYRYRLLATSEGTLGGTAVSTALAFTTPHTPRVASVSVSNVSSAFADLHAQIAPLGADTSYHFEYSSDGVAWVKAPVPDADVGSGGPGGGAEAGVVQQIGPLRAATLYRVRLSAQSQIEGVTETTVAPEGSEVTFTTLSETAPGLPDGRAYELVTPPNKGSAEDMFGTKESELNGFAHSGVGYPSVSGEEVLLETRAAIGPFAAAGENAYVFRRSASERSWATIPLASPSLGVQDVGLDVFDPEDFSLAAITDFVGSEASAGGVRDLSLLGPSGGPYRELHGEAKPNVNTEPGTHIVGASRDLSDVLLESTDHTLVPGLEHQDTASHALYGWSGGQFSLASVDPNGVPFACGATLGQGIAPLSGGVRHNAVSADGSQVLFTAPDPYAIDDGPGCWNGATGNAPQLYMRSGGETIEVSAPEAAVIEAGSKEPGERPVQHSAVFVGASEDGSRVFFLTETELTAEAAQFRLHDPELYECEIVEEGNGRKCRLTRVSAGEPGHELAAGTGNLSGATGTGTLTKESAEVGEVVTTAGGFTVGQGVSGVGIPAGTTIVAVGSGTLTLSANATASGSTVALSAGSNEVTELKTSTGSFVVGETISGVGIPAGTTITVINPGTLTLSSRATLSGSAVALDAGGGHAYTVPAVSADGADVYFTSFEALAPGATVRTITEKGPVNLYRHDAATGTVYVATVDTRDYPSSFVDDWFAEGTDIRGQVALENEADWYTSPDGRYLLLASTSELTGYDTTEATPGARDCPVHFAKSGAFGHCIEVYRYDAEAAEKGERAIVCVSCDPSGARPVSNAFFAYQTGMRAPAAGSVRAMSDDGSYAFFDSADPLVSQASNGTLDVYEWEARGRGGCALEQGCVHLISSGDERSPSYFLGASADGSNVFFGTHARLVSQDTDESGDLYDARIGGGFPAQGGRGSCEGNACRNPPPAPIDATLGSLTFAGPGNASVQALPQSAEKPKPSSAAQTRAKRLAHALKACRKRPKKKRAACERNARKRYAPARKRGKR